jgi:hypothetical protein
MFNLKCTCMVLTIRVILLVSYKKQELLTGTLAIVGSRYRVKTNKSRDTGNSSLKIQWRQTKQGTPAIVGSRYRVKTNKTRNTGNFCLSSLSIFSLLLPVFLVCLFSFSILILLLPVSLVLFVFTLYLDPTIAGVNKTRNTGNSRLKIQSEDKHKIKIPDCRNSLADKHMIKKYSCTTQCCIYQ